MIVVSLLFPLSLGARGAAGAAIRGVQDSTRAAEFVYVVGEVRAPGKYKFSQGLVVKAAIELAGGVTSGASGDFTVKIGRTINGRTQTIEASLEDILEPGDVVSLAHKR
jgi:protein involved in polysaccharide export with SLBB domain